MRTGIDLNIRDGVNHVNSGMYHFGGGNRELRQFANKVWRLEKIEYTDDR